MDEGAAGRAAGLSAPGEVHARDDGRGDLVRVGIGERDQGVLAAEFKQHRLDACRRRPSSPPCRPGTLPMRETMATSGCWASAAPDIAPAGEHVEHARRQQPVDEFGKAQRTTGAPDPAA